VAPKLGMYVVVFEASVGGVTVRATRDLAVIEDH